MRLFIGILGLLLCCGTPAAGAAPAFHPDKPVRLVVPFPPGGGTDSFARILGDKLSRMWGQQIVVENRSGAQGSIGTAHAAKMSADGYSLLLAHQGVFTVNPHIYKDTGFDSFKDFEPVSRATQQPFALVARPDVPVQTLAGLVDLAKKKPGKLTYGTSSSAPQLTVELLKNATDIKMLHVGYKGASPALLDILAGNIDLLVANPASISQYVKSGKLKALVLFGPDRLDEVLPGAPTAAEAGFPDLGKMPEWYGVVVPAGTPSDVVSALNADIHEALADADVQKRVRALGFVPSPSSPQAFGQQIRRDYDSWGEVAKRAGLSVEQ